MNTPKILIFSCILVILTSCIESKESAADGNCSQSYVNDYNSVVFALQNATPYWDNKRTINDPGSYHESRNVYNACNIFFSAHNSNSLCSVNRNSQPTTISGEDLAPYCNTAQAIVYRQLDASLQYDPTMSRPFVPDQQLVIPPEDPFGGGQDGPVIVVPQANIPELPRLENVTPEAPQTLPALRPLPEGTVVTETPEPPQELPEVTATPAAPATQPTLPTLPTLPETVGDADNSPVNEQTAMAEITAQRLRVVITNVETVKRNLGEEVFFVQGIDSNLSESSVLSNIANGETYCQLNSMQREAWRKKLKQNMILQVVSVNEAQVVSVNEAVDKKSLTITLENPRSGLTLTCVKQGVEPFRLGQVQKAISVALKIEAP